MKFLPLLILIFFNSYGYNYYKGMYNAHNTETNYKIKAGVGVKNKDFKLTSKAGNTELVWNYDNALNAVAGFNANFKNFKISTEFDYAFIAQGLASYSAFANTPEFYKTDKVKGYDYTAKLITNFSFAEINENNINLNLGLSYNKLKFKSFPGYTVTNILLPINFTNNTMLSLLNSKSLNGIIGLGASNEETEFYVNGIFKLNSNLCIEILKDEGCSSIKTRESLGFELGFNTKMDFFSLINPIFYASYNFEEVSTVLKNAVNQKVAVSYKSHFVKLGFLLYI